MRIVESNRLGVLADDLIDNWPRESLDQLSSTQIVVPSLGMARWLTFRLASAFGICAQVDFVYPAHYVWSLFARVIDGLDAHSPFDADELTWRIYRAFGRVPRDAAFAPVRAYLESGDARDKLALARRIAHMYAEILAQRPAWAPAWQRGQLLHLEPIEHERWQSLLWQAIASEIPEATHVHPRDAFFEILANDVSLRSRLPAHVVVFGVAQMAPPYQEVFAELSKYTEVTVYLVNPSQAYWFDLVSQKATARRALRQPLIAASYDAGNSLLSSLGRQIQHNLVMWGIGDEDRQLTQSIVLDERFVEPGRTTLLQRMQSVILSGEDDVKPSALEASDHSIQVHVCHSLARQLEVLHDQLLDALDGKGDGARLVPGEIVVMVPDLDSAAPMIEAVFGSAPPERHIAYTVSGRSRDVATPILDAFFSILALPSSRFTLSQINELLATPSIASRLGLDEIERDRIALWLEKAGVRWGIDEAQRMEHGLPEGGHHTFAQGLASLILGYAVSSDEPLLFDDVIAFDEIEGKSAEILGTFTRFLSELVASVASLAANRSPIAWAGHLRRLMDQVFDARCDPLFEIKRLDTAISAAVAPVIATAFDEEVPLAVMVDAIRHALTQGAPGAVPGGAVTFCGFGPLRQIPYRMVCAIELNGDGLFPRNPVRAEFDLLGRDHRAGDRDPQNEDRAAFLDAVLAASDRLFLSYTGRSVRDNAALAPSSVLDELLKAASALLDGEEGGVRRIVIEHPLQPFSARYFDGGALFSYASELLPAASSERHALPDFLPAPLPEPEAELRDVDIDTLVKALRTPIKFLLEKRLGLSFRDALHTIEDDEPVSLSTLDRLRLRDKLYPLYRGGIDDEQINRIGRAFAEAPENVLGEVALKPELRAVKSFASAVARDEPDDLFEYPFVLKHGAYRISGTLTGLHSGGRFDARATELNDLQLLRMWVCHLLLHLIAERAGVRTSRSILICIDKKAMLPEIADAKARFDELLDLYWRALSEPVPLVRKASCDYAAKGASEPVYRSLAKEWRKRGTDNSAYVERERREYRIVYKELLADLPEGFREVSKTVFGPLFAALQLGAIDDAGGLGQPGHIAGDSLFSEEGRS